MYMQTGKTIKNLLPFSLNKFLNHTKKLIMKKMILAALMFAAVATVSYAGNSSVTHSVKVMRDGRHISASQVPAAVKATFNAMHPDATNVRWEVERNNGMTIYEAKFKENGQCFKDKFAADGTFLEEKRISCR